MVLSNKGLIAHLWAREPSHPNLLPCFFEGDPACRSLGDSYVRKPLLSARAPMSRFFARGSPSPGRPALRRGRVRAAGARRLARFRRAAPPRRRLDGRRRGVGPLHPRIGRAEPATMPCSCRTGSSQSRGGKGRSRSGPSPIATVSGRPHRAAARPRARTAGSGAHVVAPRRAGHRRRRGTGRAGGMALHRLLRVALHAAGIVHVALGAAGTRRSSSRPPGRGRRRTGRG